MINIMAIDPGVSGGITFYHKGKAYAFNMPDTNKEFIELIDRFHEDYGKFICFIELVQLWTSDSNASNAGKQFRIVKMTNDFNTKIELLKIRNVPYIKVSPKTWQKQLGLLFLYEKKKMDYSKYKQFRKNKYKRFAAKRFPYIKVTLKNSDALCILQYGIEVVTLYPKKLLGKIENKETLTLFK